MSNLMPRRPGPTLRLESLLSPGEVMHYATVTPNMLPTRLHQHDFDEIYWVTEGQGEELWQHDTRSLVVGDVAIVRHDDMHGIRSVDGLTFRNIAFARDDWHALTQRYPAHVLDYFAESLEDRRRSMSVDAIRYLDQSIGSIRQGRRDQAALDHFLLTVCDLLGRETVPTSIPDWLSQLIDDTELIRQGVDAMVEASHHTAEHVARSCRLHYDATPTQLVNRARLDHAARLLRRADTRVSEACYDSGFSHLGHFHQCFKARFGMTPRQYQQRQLAIAPRDPRA